MPSLLDSNAWIDYLKHPQSPVRVRLEQRSPEEGRVCSVVKAELFHGARNMAGPSGGWHWGPKHSAPYISLPFDDAAAEHYARIRHELEVGGLVIGPNDLLIAAICLANDCTLATGNVASFSGSPDCAWKIGQWRCDGGTTREERWGAGRCRGRGGVVGD